MKIIIRYIIYNYCHAPKMANDKQEAVLLIYLLKAIMSRH